LNNIKKCCNDCIFCFVKQLPKNLRKTLYLKDDDYILSFTKGNFITLTNLTQRDLDKIIKYDLSPLYVSVHSTDNEIRKILFNNPSHAIGLKNLRYLDSNGIETHIQIVLMPGINDGNSLKETLNDLKRQYHHIRTIGIVPVGITKYNKDTRLKVVDRQKALETINIVRDYEDIFVSDEFFLIAGEKIPSHLYYKDFSQIENGIGMTSDFLYQSHKFLVNYGKRIKSGNKKNMANKRILIITSEYGSKIFLENFQEVYSFIKDNNLSTRAGLEFEVISNVFLGSNIKVTGLLSGHDIINALQKKDTENYDKILLPDIIFNDED
jgi:putative radical SAM enzyme (TIGR03279 family)